MRLSRASSFLRVVSSSTFGPCRPQALVRPLPVDAAPSRSYAQIAHNIYAVIPQYDFDPRPMEAWSRPASQLGSAASKRMRKLRGNDARIPGVLMRPGQDPLLISVNPNHIQKWLVKEHFLGRRYLLSIDGAAPIEVYPTTLGMNPMSLFPESVSFAVYNGVMPRQRLDPSMRFKIRKFDEMYMKEEKLVRSIETLNAKLKAEARKPSPFKLDEPESFTKPYANVGTRNRALSLEEEVRQLIVDSRKGEILKLEPEEVDRDEVMQVEEEEDE